MKYFKFLFIIFFLWITNVSAQEKTLTFEEAFKRSVYPKYLDQLQWIGTSNDYCYVAANSIVKGNVNNQNKDTILTLSALNAVMKASTEKEIDGIPQLSWINSNSFYFTENNKVFSYDFAAKKITVLNKLNEKGENVDLSKTSYNAAYTIDNNLYVSVNGAETAVTSDKEENIVNGKSVHRDEFGISKGTFWSPTGKLLAYYRMDQTMVTDYPLVHITETPASEELIKYPMAGMTSHQVTVGVYNPQNGKTIFLKTGEPKEQYLTNISWSPDEKYIYIAVINRSQTLMKLNQYDAVSGNFVKTLFEEKNEKYIEPVNPMCFLKTNPDQFIWQSRNNGYNHLFLYDTSGKLIKQLTQGNWEVTELLGLDATEKFVYFMAAAPSPIENNLYSADIKKGKIVLISTNKGSHSAQVSNDGKYAIDNYSSITVANSYLLLSTAGKTIQTVFASENPLKNYKMGEMSIFTIKAKDSSDLYCRLIKPANFDPKKKYPTIVYVYGGPHTQLVTDSWLGGSGMFLQYLAAKGYVVFTLDNHGSSGRGLAFEQAIHRNIGAIEMEDQLLGVDYLKKLSFVDTTRMGVHGWSYGGFMTISMLLKNPGMFKTAVAGGPVIDWKYYEIMYGERYMDTPEENPLGYDNANLLNFAKNLKGKLLIIHGTVDATVVWQHSLAFLKKCVDLGKQLDYFVYPEHEHNVRGKDRLHLYKKIETYFDDFL